MKSAKLKSIEVIEILKKEGDYYLNFKQTKPEGYCWIKVPEASIKRLSQVLKLEDVKYE